VPADLRQLCDDLLAERAELDAMVAGLDAAGWRAPTPAPGWSVLDQVTHLAFFDDTARLAVTDPAAFRAERDRMQAASADLVEAAAEAHRHLDGPTARAWLQAAGTALVEAVRDGDPARRVEWFGPDMSLASVVTARIMETWAHAQDVADTLGVTRAATDRLRHVAFLGLRALANSFAAHGLAAPDRPVRLELEGPAGDLWVIGPADAAEVVRGPALDFCLVVTRRRHRADTALRAEGEVADRWLDLAQAFAGPPGPGRRPGQFRSGGPG
jgi:uncharacterized protein (TIGR03084 family)